MKTRKEGWSPLSSHRLRVMSELLLGDFQIGPSVLVFHVSVCHGKRENSYVPECKINTVWANRIKTEYEILHKRIRNRIILVRFAL